MKMDRYGNTDVQVLTSRKEAAYELKMADFSYRICEPDDALYIEYTDGTSVSYTEGDWIGYVRTSGVRKMVIDYYGSYMTIYGTTVTELIAEGSLPDLSDLD